MRVMEKIPKTNHCFLYTHRLNWIVGMELKKNQNKGKSLFA